MDHFLQSCSQLVVAQHTLLQVVVPPQVQDFVLPPFELCEVPASPFLQLVEFVLGVSTTLCSFQFCVICKLAECILSPITQMIN